MMDGKKKKKKAGISWLTGWRVAAGGGVG